MTIRNLIGASTLGVMLGFGSPVNANDDWDFTLIFPDGVACIGFDLEVSIRTPDNRVFREWTDENGNPVRMFQGGKGNELLFRNLDDPWVEEFYTKTGGSVEHKIIHPDGSETAKATGHNVLVWFPADLPDGPWVRLYVGKVVYTISSDGIWTLEEANGKETDICAALSG